jgi:hypothetical protein
MFFFFSIYLFSFEHNSLLYTFLLLFKFVFFFRILNKNQNTKVSPLSLSLSHSLSFSIFSLVEFVFVLIIYQLDFELDNFEEFWFCLLYVSVFFFTFPLFCFHLDQLMLYNKYFQISHFISVCDFLEIIINWLFSCRLQRDFK